MKYYIYRFIDHDGVVHLTSDTDYTWRYARCQLTPDGRLKTGERSISARIVGDTPTCLWCLTL